MKKRFKTIAFVCLATMAVVSCDENNDNPIPSGETFDLGDVVSGSGDEGSR